MIDKLKTTLFPSNEDIVRLTRIANYKSKIKALSFGLAISQHNSGNNNVMRFQQGRFSKRGGSKGIQFVSVC